MIIWANYKMDFTFIIYFFLSLFLIILHNPLTFRSALSITEEGKARVINSVII